MVPDNFKRALEIHMKRFLVILVLALASSTARAEPIDPSPNRLGLYLDLEATQVQSELPEYTSNNLTDDDLIDLYLIFTNPTYPYICGGDFRVECTGGVYLLRNNWPPEAIVLGEYRAYEGTQAVDLTVLWSNPIPTTTATVLLYMKLLPLSAGEIFLLPSQYPNGLNPDLPTIFLPPGDWGFDPVSVYTAAGAGNPNICFGSEGDCGHVVRTEKTTLDHLKSLYR